MFPSLYMLGWNIFDTNVIFGALLGYSSENVICNRNVPPYHIVSTGPIMYAYQLWISSMSGVATIPSSSLYFILRISWISFLCETVAIVIHFYNFCSLNANYKLGNYSQKLNSLDLEKLSEKYQIEKFPKFIWDFLLKFLCSDDSPKLFLFFFNKCSFLILRVLKKLKNNF